ncbi:DUF6152 family protein [Streptomyces tricolor]|uniref:DUF6152 family protein n=1 Tax=Streptomyces tricolor TaxID=68277 RepID=UPI00380CE29E
MRFTSIAAPRARTSIRRVRLATASLVSATALLGFSAGAAQTHHGLDDFDTDRLYYIAGTISQIRWGEPHSYFTVAVEDDLPADTPSSTCRTDCATPPTVTRSTPHPPTTGASTSSVSLSSSARLQPSTSGCSASADERCG